MLRFLFVDLFSYNDYQFKAFYLKELVRSVHPAIPEVSKIIWYVTKGNCGNNELFGVLLVECKTSFLIIEWRERFGIE